MSEADDRAAAAAEAERARQKILDDLAKERQRAADQVERERPQQRKNGGK